MQPANYSDCFSVMTVNSQKLAVTPKRNFLEQFQSEIRLLFRVSCSRLDQGHGYPSQTFSSWNVDFVTIIFIQRTRTLPLTHSLLTEYVNYTMT